MKHNGILGRHYGFVAHDLLLYGHVTVNKWFFTPVGKHSVALCTCGSSTYKLLNFMKFLEVSGDFLFLCGCQFTLPVRDDVPALSFGFFLFRQQQISWKCAGVGFDSELLPVLYLENGRRCMKQPYYYYHYYYYICSYCVTVKACFICSKKIL